MIPVADDVALWRQRAAATRNAARQMRDIRCRWAILDVADSYERMAQIAERRLARKRAIGRVSRLGLGFASLVGVGTGWALTYLLHNAVR